jgi:trk system potassium uptake protein TrkH
MGTVRQFPALVILLIAAAALMLVPAAHAAVLENWWVARTFLYHAVFFMVIGVILGLATMNRRPRLAERYHLMTLLLVYLLIPVVLALPLVHLVPSVGVGAAYFEMVSSLTTTGATIFDRPRLIADPLHLWRALVGWIGGLVILVAAFAVLAPLNLGGFEISRIEVARSEGRSFGSLAEANARILRCLRMIFPVYAGLTGALTLLLVLAGDRPFVALCHAMATLSTSGISPVGGIEGSPSGVLGEMAIAVFLLAAISHKGLLLSFRRGRGPSLQDPQVQLMLISVLGVTLLLFTRSFIGAYEIDRQDNFTAALQAIWGSLFTVLSFLTTTGFESRHWQTMQLWSGLGAPGIVLLGVAVMGGGIATTAGGIKLLRLYALYRHGLREMDLLVHPSAIGRRGRGEAAISDNGAQIAFVFLMLFLVVLALVMIALTATGLAFEQSLALAVAALTTTGPAIGALGGGLSYAELGPVAKAILCFGMVVGRMEALVIVALFNPAYWRP